jgi:hypothetical protein
MTKKTLTRELHCSYLQKYQNNFIILEKKRDKSPKLKPLELFISRLKL